METYKYTCNYCQKEYIPTKRGKQKFCSGSCRTSKWNRKNKIKHPLDKLLTKKSNDAITNTPEKEKISHAGVKDAAVGAFFGIAAYDGLKYLFSDKKIDQSLKSEIESLIEKIGRYRKINNHHVRLDGALPFFDLYTNEIVYLHDYLKE